MVEDHRLNEENIHLFFLLFCMKKHFIAAFVFTIGLFLSSSASAIALHVGSGANFNWCTTNSGTIAVSYSECIGLAWLYQETNGDSW